VLLAHRQWGVLAAVLGATVGAALMLLPSCRRSADTSDSRSVLGCRRPAVGRVPARSSRSRDRAVAGVRGSVRRRHLVVGTITRLNYVQKIGQEFTAAALILAVVTPPRVGPSPTVT